jgi:hypothetical protein
MLRKLLKYETKATARIFLPLYAVLFSIALINRLISSLSPLEVQAPKIISMIIFITILVGMFVVTFVMMLQRFYKNLLSEEGYLMFTLPTLPWKLIMSKLLVAVMWTVTSGIAAYISIFIIFMNLESISFLFTALIEFVGELYALFGLSSFLFIAEILLTILMSLASGILIFYASMAIGHLFNRHKILASIGAFIALSTITQILFVLLVSILPSIPNDILFGLTNLLNPEASMHLAVWFAILTAGILATCYFVITNYILSNRLNLE